MNEHAIVSLSADEILDSRGNPTLDVGVVLASGVRAHASVPSGASTGAFEAVELRDGDAGRYGGKGVLNAAGNVETELLDAVRGLPADDQSRLDAALNAADGTDNKQRLGANAILGVSMACAKAAALAHHLPLYRYLGGLDAHVLPVPMFNVLNGGKHAAGGPDIQEFKIVPAGAPTFREALRYGAETYHALRELLHARGAAVNVGDEGGFVPQLPNNAAGMEVLIQAIEKAGYRPGEDIWIGIDAAATSFFRNGKYHLERDDKVLSADEIMAYWGEWVGRYPLISLEDPLADEDWSGFARITAQLGDRVQIVGDDLFVTNPRFLQRGIDEHCCNSVLIKFNQIGTVTETLETMALAAGAGYTRLVSHRSGETDDTIIADLAVAGNTGQIKAGAPARGERVAKYNRLAQIERELGASARFAGLAAFPRAVTARKAAK